MFQLPPVVKQGAERELMHDLYHTDDFFFYKANVIKRMRLVKIEFQKVYRQEDQDFLRILENVRLNKTTPENLMHLNGRVCQPTKDDGMVITLASLNKTADALNQQRLAEIEAEDDYDEAAKQYLLLVQKKAAEGDIKEAMQQAKRFLDTVICDDDLFGCVSEIPAELKIADHWAPKFLVALLSLYGGEYEQALEYVDSVLAQHQCQEALYVKSRCLAKLERFVEADAVNVLMGDVFDMSTPDAKVLYSIAMLNELHIGDPGLNLMQQLVAVRPKYDKVILSLRFLMKRKGLALVKTSDDPRELVDEFNSNMPEEEFSQKLVTAREKAPKAVEYMLRLIKKQMFEG